MKQVSEQSSTHTHSVKGVSIHWDGNTGVLNGSDDGLVASADLLAGHGTAFALGGGTLCSTVTKESTMTGGDHPPPASFSVCDCVSGGELTR